MVGYTHSHLTVPNDCAYDPDGRQYQSCGGRPFSLLGSNAVRDPVDGWFYVDAPGLDEPLLAVKRTPTTYEQQARLQVVSDGMGQLLSIADSAGIYNNVFEDQGSYTPGTWATSGIATRVQTFDPRRLTTDTGAAISSFRTRQYDPATGSWLQEDHAGMSGGVNLYEYNGNDPNSFRDPMGTCDRSSDTTCKAVRACGEGHNTVVVLNDQTEEVRADGTRSWRNDNPGNLSAGTFSAARGSIGAVGGFAVFPSASAGAAAQIDLLRTSSYQGRSVNEAIKKYAPPNDNPTSRYQEFVSKTTGTSGTTPMSALSPEQLSSMQGAMAQFEGYRSGSVTVRGSTHACGNSQ